MSYPALNDAVLPARLAILTTSMELRDRPAKEFFNGEVAITGQPLKVRVQGNLRGVGGADLELYFQGNLVFSGSGRVATVWGRRVVPLVFSGEEYERIHNLLPCQKIVFSFSKPCETANVLQPLGEDVRGPAIVEWDLRELLGEKTPFYAEVHIYAGYCTDCATVDLEWGWYRYRVARIDAESFEAVFTTRFIAMVGPVERIVITLSDKAKLLATTRICYWRVPVESGQGELYIKWWRLDSQGNKHYLETWRLPVEIWHACLDDPAKVPFSVVYPLADVGILAYESILVPRVVMGCLSSP